MDDLGTLSRTRAAGAGVLALLVAVSAGRATLRTRLVPTDAGGLDPLLHAAALGALTLCAAWAALVLLAVAGTRRPGAPRWCPRRCRPLLAAICGTGIVLTAALPSSAAGHGTRPGGAEPPPLGRAYGAPARPVRGPNAATAPILVRPGDSLWSIVERRHPGAGAAEVTRRVRALYDANRERIGADPDLLRPGTVLRPGDRPVAARPRADRGRR